MTPEERARLIATLESDYVAGSEYMDIEINEYEEKDIVLAVSELKRIDVLEKALRPFADALSESQFTYDVDFKSIAKVDLFMAAKKALRSA